jgi:hypothetical protein
MKTSNSEHTKIYKEAKSKLQKEMRNSYWNYIENMIFDLKPKRTRPTKVQ